MEFRNSKFSSQGLERCVLSNPIDKVPFSSPRLAAAAREHRRVLAPRLRTQRKCLWAGAKP